MTFVRHVLHLRSSGGVLGAENVILELARHSGREGFQVTIGLLHDPRRPTPDLVRVAAERGIGTALLPCRGRLDPRAIVHLRRLVREHHVDILHSHGYKEDVYAVLSCPTTPRIATNHLWKRTSRRLKLYARLDAKVLRLFDHVVAVSEPILQELRAAGIAEDRLRKIVNGVDVSRFDSPEWAQAGPQRRQALGLKPGSPILGMISSLSMEKGHAYVLDALPEILKQYPDARLLIVGAGELRSHLERLVSDLGLDGSVIFTGQRNDIPEFLACIDIFVLASTAEGMPMALLEAMATRKPIVATNVGSVGEAVRIGETGILVAPRDPAHLAAAILSLLGDSDHARELGAAARRLVEKQFSSPIMARAYCQLYDQVLGHR